MDDIILSDELVLDMNALNEKCDKLSDIIFDALLSSENCLIEKFIFGITLSDILLGYDQNKYPDITSEEFVQLGMIVDAYMQSFLREYDIEFGEDEYNFSKFVVTELCAPFNAYKKIYALKKEYTLINIIYIGDDG